MNFNYSSNNSRHFDNSESLNASLIAKRTSPTQHHDTLLPRVILVVLIIAGVVFFAGTRTSTATLTLDFGSQHRIFQGEVVKYMTVHDALTAAVVAGDVPLRVVVDTEGKTRIASLDDRMRFSSQDIRVTLNGNSVETAAMHTTLLHAHDEVVVMIPLMQ